MGEAHTFAARYPQRELEIHRLCSLDTEFRSACEDYEQASSALRYWQGRPDEAVSKIRDYENFLNELEIEILTRLDRSQVNVNARNS